MVYDMMQGNFPYEPDLGKLVSVHIHIIIVLDGHEYKLQANCQKLTSLGNHNNHSNIFIALLVESTLHAHTFSFLQQPPRVDLSNITAFLELSQLGFQAAQDSNKLFLHGGPYVIVSMMRYTTVIM